MIFLTFHLKNQITMNYLNEEYKNLSDLDKKNILPGIIKFLQEEKQKVDDKNNVDVKMTLTTPNCPVAESLPMEVENTVKEVKEVNKVNLELVWDPPWDKSMITEAGKLELNL